MSTPRIDPNDPKWTAYVLGELDKADVAAVEALIASSSEARRLVEELRASAILLEDAWDDDPASTLTAAQRAAVRTAADAGDGRSSWWSAFTLPRTAMMTAAAAAVVVLAVMLPRPPRTVAPVVPAAPHAVTPADGGLNDIRRDGAAVPLERHPDPLVPPPSSNQAQAGQPVSTGRRAADNESANAGATDERTMPVPAATPAASPAAAPASAAASDAGREPRASAKSEALTVTGQAPVIDVPTVRPESLPGRSLGGLVSGNAARDTATAQVVPLSPKVNGFAPLVGGSGFPVPSGNTEAYARVSENGFVRVSQEPLATFSIDVDTASYANVRRFLTQNQLPPSDAVRTEELINYFTYDYARPSGPHPIGASLAVAAAPWNPRNRLVRIGVKAREIDASRRPSSNLVFLIDVSGSMNTPQKLPLVKSGLKLLVDQLGENDTVSVVVYAGASGLVLPPTPGNRKDAIAQALDTLEPGGSTNGAAGIRLAYDEATAGFRRGGTNRVILMTDGDFNVGVTSQSELTRLIEDRARSGVFLSVLGFGMGNLKDSTLEMLADKGNGNYAYIDSLAEARKVLVEQMTGTLVTVAKDVKIQVDFNPAKVEAYRLIGYENRALRPEDFNDDRKDAGDMGAGHTVTALFEIVPHGGIVPGPSVDPSVFQPAAPRAAAPGGSTSTDLLVLRVRYKQPDAATSTRLDVPLADRGATFASADTDFRFAASVAAFGMILKDSPYRGEATLDWVLDTATASRGADHGGYRTEFISLVQRAITLQRRR